MFSRFKILTLRFGFVFEISKNNCKLLLSPRWTRLIYYSSGDRFAHVCGMISLIFFLGGEGGWVGVGRRTYGEKCANKINPKKGKACARVRSRCTNVAATDTTAAATTVTTSTTTATATRVRRTRNSVRKLRVWRRRRSRDQCCCSRVRRAVVGDSIRFLPLFFSFFPFYYSSSSFTPPLPPTVCVPYQTRTGHTPHLANTTGVRT